ncbi:MAG: Ig-like domain-containing protein, partial [Syntrophaceae bacterium]
VTECPAVHYLYCSSNALTSLDVTECPALTYLDCYLNALTESAVDAVLVALVAGSVEAGNCGLSGNAAPSATGLAAITTLQGRDWDCYAGGQLESLSIIEEDPLTVYVGGTLNPKVTATFDDDSTLGAALYLDWSSNHPEYATVSSEGTVTGISEGEVIITASHGAIFDTATVTVSAAP